MSYKCLNSLTSEPDMILEVRILLVKELIPYWQLSQSDTEAAPLFSYDVVQTSRAIIQSRLEFTQRPSIVPPSILPRVLHQKAWASSKSKES